MDTLYVILQKRKKKNEIERIVETKSIESNDGRGEKKPFIIIGKCSFHSIEMWLELKLWVDVFAALKNVWVRECDKYSSN